MEISDEVPGHPGILGLYRGIPQPDRGGGYSAVLPDRITIFRRPWSGSSGTIQRCFERRPSTRCITSSRITSGSPTTACARSTGTDRSGGRSERWELGDPHGGGRTQLEFVPQLVRLRPIGGCPPESTVAEEDLAVRGSARAVERDAIHRRVVAQRERDEEPPAVGAQQGSEVVDRPDRFVEIPLRLVPPDVLDASRSTPRSRTAGGSRCRARRGSPPPARVRTCRRPDDAPGRSGRARSRPPDHTRWARTRRRTASRPAVRWRARSTMCVLVGDARPCSARRRSRRSREPR